MEDLKARVGHLYQKHHKTRPQGGVLQIKFLFNLGKLFIKI